MPVGRTGLAAWEVGRRVLPLAGLMVGAGLFLSGLAAYVSRRRSSAAGISLAVLLLAVAWWGLFYAVELSTTDLPARTRWGDLKYVGVCVLGPAWLTFVLQYTGRARLVTKRLLLALSIEPVLLLALLANPATHDLVRKYPDNAATQELPVVGTGPAFWAHLVYENALLVVATVIFVRTMVKVSRLYWRLAATLVAAALLPWAANLLHNFEVGWFARIDLTPFAFIVTGGVLVWGLFRERLVNLTPVARGVIFNNMADAVFVLDAFSRIVDTNRSALALLGRRRGLLIGSLLSDVLTTAAGVEPAASAGELAGELTVSRRGEQRHYDVRRQPLPDRSGTTAGELVVLRDITERIRGERQLHELLAERTRVASALQSSLLPAQLPPVPSVDVAALYEPAGDGSEIGGDFFDVFPLGPDDWGVVLGDISGKGAEAAAITALARYTLRTLAGASRKPSRTLRDLNARLLIDGTDEQYCTLVYAVVRPTSSGVRMTVCLGGHHPPLVLRASGATEAVGRIGTALGLVDNPDLYDTVVDLAEGDLICLFTDGLVEARRGPDLFGPDRAASVLGEYAGGSSEEVVKALAAAARLFHGDNLSDDLALLVLRARPSSSP